ncbi:MAG: hypothetical protein JO148_16945 [Acidimicrobiia bacterium]|nr:hypothetical protein [Acidimicrobiia bacterium]
MRTRWKDLSPEKKRIIVVVVVLEIISTIFAFRDLSDRSDADVRVSKRFWRLLMLSNPGNSVIYWVAGRR